MRAEDSLEKLAHMLRANPCGQSGPDSCAANVETVIIGPRANTISPWSSKATDIAHVAGLEGAFVERAIEYSLPAGCADACVPLLCDPMLERVFDSWPSTKDLPGATGVLRGMLREYGTDELVRLNGELGLSLSPKEIAVLCKLYENLGRGPTDAELMMYSQVNSEHCRHKIFNASWEIDGVARPNTLFQMFVCI